MGPCNLTKWPSSVRVCMIKPTPLSTMSLQRISCPRGPLISAAFASVEHLRKSSEYGLKVTKHEYLLGAVDEGGSEEVVDRERLAGRRARRVAAGAGEAVPELLVIKHDSIPVVGNLDHVGLSHVRSRSVVAADPSCQPSPGVGTHGQGCPVQSPEGLVFPVEVLAAVRAQESVGHPEFEDAELGARLQVDRLSDVHLEAGIVPRDPLAGVAVDRRHMSLSSTPETPPRCLRALADLPGSVWVGPPGIDDSLRAGAALDVVAFTVADRARSQQFPRHLAEDRPHARLRGTFGRIAPKTCLPSGLAD